MQKSKTHNRKETLRQQIKSVLATSIKFAMEYHSLIEIFIEILPFIYDLWIWFN